MKRIITTCFFFCLTISLRAQNADFDSVGVINMQIGKVIMKGDSWFIRTGEGNLVKDYYPVNMPDNMKKNSQDVVFDAAIGRIPANVRMSGTPIKILSIRKLYKTKPKDTGEDLQTIQSKNSTAFDSVGYVKNGKGTIIKIGDTWLIEESKNNSIIRYVPEYIPDDFKIEKLAVSFSGVIGKQDPNVRSMGKPFIIKELMAEEETELDRSHIQEPLKDYYPLDSAGYLEKSEGIIKIMNGVFIIEVGTNRYLPVILPDEFKQENMIVLISGIIGKIPANVRLIGTPIELDTIEKKQE